MINLQQPDFTTATRMTSAINKALAFAEAKQLDAFSVRVKANDSFAGTLSELVYHIESLDVPVDTPAVVILNEKTGNGRDGRECTHFNRCDCAWQFEHPD